MSSRYPSDWRASLFGDVAKITCGVASTPEYVSPDDGVPFFSARNVQSEKLDLSKLQYISHELHKKLTKNTKPEKGDILLTRVGAGIGEAAVVDIDFEFSVYVSLTLIKCSPELNSEFVKYLLNSSYYRYLAIREQFAGGGVQNLNVQMVKEYTIPIPPLPEQRKIAQILSTWDKAIATTERLLANKQQQKKALMQRLLTGKQRFAGFEGEWRMCHLRDIVTLEYGKSPKDIIDIDGEYPIVGTGGISGLTNQPLVTQSSVVVGRKGTIDKPALLQVPFWPIDTVFYCLAKPNIDITWFYYWVSSLQLKKYNESSGLPSLSRETLYSIKVSVPPFDEQQTIASVLAKADSELSIIQKQLDNLKLQKKALMQQLLTGKRRVKVDEAAA